MLVSPPQPSWKTIFIVILILCSLNAPFSISQRQNFSSIFILLVALQMFFKSTFFVTCIYFVFIFYCFIPPYCQLPHLVAPSSTSVRLDLPTTIPVEETLVTLCMYYWKIVLTLSEDLDWKRRKKALLVEYTGL